MKSVLLDTSTYSNFARAGHYSLLERIFKGRLYVVSLVVDEAVRGSKRFPELGVLSTSVADGRTSVIDYLTENEYALMAGMPRKFSDTDKEAVNSNFTTGTIK